MKASNYNLLTTTVEGNVAAYNTITGALITLEEDDTAITQVLEGKIPPAGLDSQSLQVLCDNGYVIEDDCNELEILKVKSAQERFATDKLHLSILVTLDCNFDCPYCFEEHRKERLSEDVQNRIESFVRMKSKTITRLVVDWYGGEPLLNFKTIQQLNRRLLEVCLAENVGYTCSMTTNGYLLNDRVVEKLKEMRCESLQITVDGPPEIHNATRQLAKSTIDTFDRVLSNLINASQYFTIFLRTNVDEQTIDHIPELLKILHNHNVNQNVILSVKSILSSDTRPYPDMRMSTFATKVRRLYALARKYGITVGDQLNPSRSGFCIVDSAYQFMVDPSGMLYKCSETFTNRDNVGKINEDGTYSLQFDRWSRWMSKDPFADTDCLQCKVLPLCYGGCSLKRLTKGEDWCTELKYNILQHIQLQSMEGGE